MDSEDAKFLRVLQAAVKECHRIGYPPMRFEQMLRDEGAFGAARTLLDKPGISDGFGTLLMKGRLDLTVEAIILQPEWQRHFTPKQRETARERLKGTVFALPDV